MPVAACHATAGEEPDATARDVDIGIGLQVPDLCGQAIGARDVVGIHARNVLTPGLCPARGESSDHAPAPAAQHPQARVFHDQALYRAVAAVVVHQQ